MKKLILPIIVSILAFGLVSVRAQSVPSGKPAAALTAEVEKIGNQLSLVITNPSSINPFLGTASVTLDGSDNLPVQLGVKLQPGETVRLPLYSFESGGDHYVLKVYSRTGALVLFKVAAIIPGIAGSERTKKPKATQSELQLKVNVKFSHGLTRRDAAASTTKVDPILLNFEIESPTPIKEANLILNSEGFKKRLPITVKNRADYEFKLPDDFNDRVLSYKIADRAGKTMASGELNFDESVDVNAISLKELTFDRPSYAPGDAARAIIELQGGGPDGFRLVVTLKDGNGNLILQDELTEVAVKGKYRQEFILELPEEVKGPGFLTYEIFGGQSTIRVDSGEREIALNLEPADKPTPSKSITTNSEANKSNASKKVSP